MAKMEELVARVFCARNYTHEMHLRTDSYAEHMALGEFYEGVVGLIDGIAETYQGTFAVLDEIAVLSPNRKAGARDWIINEAKWIQKNRESLAGDSPVLLNMVDDLINFYYRIADKLRRG